MKKYEFVTTEYGISLGVSIGTAYYEDHYKHRIELCNILWLPRRKEFFYNHQISLPRTLVCYWESLDLTHLDSSNYPTIKDLLMELQSFGIRPWQEYSSMMEEYADKKAQTELIKQRILKHQNNLMWHTKNRDCNK